MTTVKQPPEEDCYIYFRYVLVVYLRRRPLLTLVQMMDAWNVVVVVSRYFGGIHLGPDRFKHINSVARDVITKGGFIQEANKEKEAGRSSKRK